MVMMWSSEAAFFRWFGWITSTISKGPCLIGSYKKERSLSCGAVIIRWKGNLSYYVYERAGWLRWDLLFVTSTVLMSYILVMLFLLWVCMGCWFRKMADVILPKGQKMGTSEDHFTTHPRRLRSFYQSLLSVMKEIYYY